MLVDLRNLEGSSVDKAQWAWSPSEWPHSAEDPDDVAPGQVTSAIWALSGTQAMIDGTGRDLDARSFAALQGPELTHEFSDRYGAGSDRLLARLAAREA